MLIQAKPQVQRKQHPEDCHRPHQKAEDKRPTGSKTGEGIASKVVGQSQEPEIVLKETTALGKDSVEAEIFVLNAGMVILHPFLHPFFSALGIAKQGKLEKPERAICLLQYLATGRVGDMEHELPLNKLLCGIPLEQPQSRKIRLTKKEKTEADNLLRAVIGHWSALGSTSAEGLRGTFLCREGKLTSDPFGDWQLRVEQRSFDILLADLPWGFSMIKLPWMDGLLKVEWA